VVGSRLQELLQQRGNVVIEARPGSHFQQLDDRLFQLRPGAVEDYLALWYSLSERNLLPNRVVHLWGLGPYAHRIPPPNQTGLWGYLRRLFGAGTGSALEGVLQRGYSSLLGLAAAQQQPLDRGDLRIGVVTDGVQNILGGERLLPVKATVLAARSRLERECPTLRCQCIDVILDETSSRLLAMRLISELDAEAGPAILAYRGDCRWTQDWVSLTEEAVDTETAPLRREGVYLITGGFSGAGLALARYLAQTQHARLMLPTTVTLPSRRRWDDWLAKQPADDKTARGIQLIRELEATGAHVLSAVAEPTDARQMAAVLQRTRERWGRLDGVFWGAENLTAAAVADPQAEARRLAAIQVCNHLLGEVELDFVMLLNPVAAGRLPDNTAGALADAVTLARRRRAHWVTVHSAPWNIDPADSTGLPATEGIATLVQILGRALSQALISSPAPAEAAAEPPPATTLKAGVHQRPALPNVYYPPTTELQSAIASLWQELFAISPIGIHDNFFDLGGDSMLAIQLVARLQEHFQVELPLAEALQHPTVAEQAATIEMTRRGGRSQQPSPIVTIQPVGEHPPFFCIHPAGGIVHCYVELARLLGKEQPFLALQHPGIDGNPAPYSTFEAMATHYLAAIREVQPHGPYYLGGWSFGGTVAFEIAQRLLAAGETVALLAMLDTPAPTTVGGMALRPAFDAAGIFVFMARSIGAVFGSELNITYEQLKDLTPAEQFDYVLAQAVRSQDAQALAQGREQLVRIIELFKLSDVAERSYIPRVYPGRITMLRVQSMDDYEFTGYKNHPQLHNPTFGWDTLSTQPVEVHQVPGTHMSMVAHPYVPVIAATLQQVLTTAQAGGATQNHPAEATVRPFDAAAVHGGAD
jgi:thioesterase domain-containing protein/acyl carrier protein/NAD(P)-dependent dehydrogenase (short-subunit alcohol dehydrogenase family)